MSKIDNLVLASLEKESLSLSEIIKKISNVNVEKVPTRIGVHARLKKLNQDGLIVFTWYEGKKIYSITAKGIANFRRFINQLTNLSELLIA